MHLRETQHHIVIVIVASAALVLVAGERCCRYHAERLRARGEEKVTPACGLYVRVDGRQAIRRRAIDFNLRQPEVAAVAVGDLETKAPGALRRKLYHTGSTIVWYGTHQDTASIVEHQLASGSVRLLAGYVVKQHLAYYHALIPVELNPRIVDDAP